MDPHKILKIGEKYSKKELSELLNQETLSLVREGIFNCKNSNSTLFFVDLEKKGKEDRFHFDDFFEEFEPDEFFAEDYQAQGNRFLLSLLGGSDGEPLAEAISEIFAQLPIEDLSITVGTDSADD